MTNRAFHFFTEGIPSRKDYPSGVSGLMVYLDAIFTNWPIGLSRLMNIQPFFTLITGLLVMLLFRNGFEYVPVAIVSVILAFFFITFRIYRLRGNQGVIISFWDMALIFVLNNMLYFVLPFYFESMTFPSRNLLFAPIIIGLTVTASWATVYQRLIARHPLRSSVFYALTFFCVLNLLLPILFGIRNIWSILISGVIAAAAVVFFVYPHLDMLKNRKNTATFILGVALIFTMLWFGRSLIPPAPLKLTRITACKEINDYRPVELFSRAGVNTVTDVCLYSSIFAPRGLSEKINHVWHHDGRKLLTIPLSEIRGGRKVGFGTWSCRAILEGKGLYTVEVWTAGGQLLGQGSFVIY